MKYTTSRLLGLAIVGALCVTAMTGVSATAQAAAATAPATTATQTKQPLSFKERIHQILAESQQQEQPQPIEPTKPTQTIDGLKVYDPATDTAPAEGIPIRETNFTFREPLLVRPETNAIVVHHVGIPSGEVSAQQIHDAHLANGWAGIGYHYVIHKDGVIDRGRPLATVGAHAQGRNYDTVGINVTGNFEEEAPTDAQIQSLERLIAALCRIYDLTPNDQTIIGHRDVNSTDCPGQYLYEKLPQIRADVAAMLSRNKAKADGKA